MSQCPVSLPSLVLPLWFFDPESEIPLERKSIDYFEVEGSKIFQLSGWIIRSDTCRWSNEINKIRFQFLRHFYSRSFPACGKLKNALKVKNDITFEWFQTFRLVTSQNIWNRTYTHRCQNVALGIGTLYHYFSQIVCENVWETCSRCRHH